MSSLQKNSSTRLLFSGMIAFIAWFAVLLQLWVATGSISNFLSYFTIQCNLLIAISLTITLLWTNAKAGIFFRSLGFQTAATLYIFIVALVYNTVLRGLVPLSGSLLVADTLLHVVVPILYVLYWFICRDAGSLEYRIVMYWAIFPFVYLLYSLLRGNMVHWYPYPFLNVDRFGLGKVMLNSLVVTAGFLLGGLLLVAATRLGKKDKIPVE